MMSLLTPWSHSLNCSYTTKCWVSPGSGVLTAVCGTFRNFSLMFLDVRQNDVFFTSLAEARVGGDTGYEFLFQENFSV